MQRSKMMQILLCIRFSVCILEMQDFTHIIMVLLEVDELLLEGLNLTLQVHAANIGIIDDLPQANDISLH